MSRYGPNRLYKPSVCKICRGEIAGLYPETYPHRGGHVTVDNNTQASPDTRRSHVPLWYHQSCYEILASSYVTAEIPSKEKIKDYYEATKPTYPAPRYQRGTFESVREGLLFSDHTEGILQSCFSRTLLKKLPEEILSKILTYLGECRYLIVLGETRRLFDRWQRINCEDRRERVTTSKHIFLTRMEFRGVAYISKISNVPFGKPSDESFPGELLRFPPNTRRLIVSKDHMGIRNIRPAVEGLEPSLDGSPWYEILGEPNATLSAEIDVLYNVRYPSFMSLENLSSS